MVEKVQVEMLHSMHHHQQLWSGQADVPQLYLAAAQGTAVVPTNYFSTNVLLRQHSDQIPITSMCYHNGRLIWVRIHPD